VPENPAGGDFYKVIFGVPGMPPKSRLQLTPGRTFHSCVNAFLNAF
jgi:hypothetical protein